MGILLYPGLVSGQSVTTTGDVFPSPAQSPIWIMEDLFEGLYVGSSGTGTLTISDGGTVSNNYGSIGSNPGSNGTVTVTGTGSTWTNSHSLSVGYGGTGILTISGGGAVSNHLGTIGLVSGSNAMVTVNTPPP